MVEYHYTPNELPQEEPEKEEAGPGFNIAEFVQKNKKTIKIGIAVIFALVVLYFVGSGITGNMFMTAEERELSASPDFPQLSQFEANKQYYFCGKDLTLAKRQKADTETSLSKTQINLTVCASDKLQTETELDLTQKSLATCEDKEESCVKKTDKLQSEITALNTEIESLKADIDKQEDDYYDLAENFANKFCCILNTIQENTSYVSFNIKSTNRIECLDEDHKVNGNDLDCI